jgi:hypothetical protein
VLLLCGSEFSGFLAACPTIPGNDAPMYKLIKSGFSIKLVFLSLSFIQKFGTVGFKITGWEEKLEFRENGSKSFFTKNLFVKSVWYVHCECPLTPGIGRPFSSNTGIK